MARKVDAVRIDITPMIGVLLVLLAMVMTAGISTKRADVDLIVSGGYSGPDDPLRRINVAVLTNGLVRVNEQVVAADLLVQALFAHAVSHGDRIMLTGDPAVPYGDLMAAMNRLRSAGFEQVALTGQREREW